MGLEIIWSKRTAAGYARILMYLDENRTKREVENFEQETKLFFIKLSNQPYILEESKIKGYRKSPINKLTMLMYRVKEKSNPVNQYSGNPAKAFEIKSAVTSISDRPATNGRGYRPYRQPHNQNRNRAQGDGARKCS